MSEDGKKVLNAIHELISDKELPTSVNTEDIAKKIGLSFKQTEAILESEFANYSGIQLIPGDNKMSEIGISTFFN
ncbi:MAG: hypothetical protein ABF750_09335 [Oenococcus oeni]